MLTGAQLGAVHVFGMSLNAAELTTLIAAAIAALTSLASLAWSIVSHGLDQRASERTKSEMSAAQARTEWRTRFDSAVDRTTSESPELQKIGMDMLTALTREEWVTPKDKALAAAATLTVMRRYARHE